MMELKFRDLSLMLDQIKRKIKEDINNDPNLKNYFSEKWVDKIMNIKNQKHEIMKNQDVIQDYLNQNDVEKVFNDFHQKASSLMNILIQYKQINFKEDYNGYNVAYNKICERIADLNLTMEMLEYVFNKESINEHYTNKLDLLKKSLSSDSYEDPNQLKINFD